VEKILIKKRRRIRLDPNNPYRTRDLIYTLLNRESELVIEVEQYDYVLRSLVAEDRQTIAVEENQALTRQLLDYMLNNAKGAKEAVAIYQDWRKGKITLIKECNNILVQEAVRRRFARNLKRI
jgi:hypothetical protein